MGGGRRLKRGARRGGEWGGKGAGRGSEGIEWGCAVRWE